MNTIPPFGLGTFRFQGQAVVDSVKNALDLGYRLVDTAQIYDNEADVGRAIAESGVPRDATFLTTKIWTANYARNLLIPSLKDSLAKLRTDHVDLALIHWPSPGNAVPVAEFMGALAEAKAQGLTKQIGVSNYVDLMRHAIASSVQRRSRPTRSNCTPICRIARSPTSHADTGSRSLLT